VLTKLSRYDLFYYLGQRHIHLQRNGGPTPKHRLVSRYSLDFSPNSSTASLAASNVAAKDISAKISSGVVNGAVKALDWATYEMLALDQLMFSTNGSPDFVQEHWNHVETCQTLDVSGNKHFTLANLVLLASIANRYQRSYRLAGYQCYWYASVIFDAIVHITRVQPIDGPAASKRGQFGRAKVVRGRPDTLSVIVKRYQVSWAITNARIAELKNPEIVAKRIAQSDARAAESDARVAESDAKVAELNARAAESDARVAESDAMVAELNARAAELHARAKQAEERATQLERKLAQVQQQIAGRSDNS